MPAELAVNANVSSRPVVSVAHGPLRTEGAAALLPVIVPELRTSAGQPSPHALALAQLGSAQSVVPLLLSSMPFPHCALISSPHAVVRAQSPPHSSVRPSLSLSMKSSQRSRHGSS